MKNEASVYTTFAVPTEDGQTTTNGQTTSIRLMWLTWLRAQPSHSTQLPCNQKDTRLKICK